MAWEEEGRLVSVPYAPMLFDDFKSNNGRQGILAMRSVAVCTFKAKKLEECCVCWAVTWLYLLQNQCTCNVHVKDIHIDAC